MRGHTLVELTVIMIIMALTVASLVPAARRFRDRSAVVSAREAVAGLLTEARLAAIERGEARVALRADPWRAWISTGDSVLRAISIESDFGVIVELGGARGEAEIIFDALGLGRVASRTIEFIRGADTTALVVSGYGRLRRR